VGLLKVKLFRPFPVEDIRHALAPAGKVAVIDRNISFGATGIFAQEIRAALCNLPERPPVFGYVAGLGGRDVTTDLLEDIYWQTKNSTLPEQENVWLGLNEALLGVPSNAKIQKTPLS
jgi:pyruvate/2-oxoacid:ferredoxin oxidoreductase alpha subunit